jgi:hypothetical protein
MAENARSDVAVETERVRTSRINLKNKRKGRMHLVICTKTK